MKIILKIYPCFIFFIFPQPLYKDACSIATLNISADLSLMISDETRQHSSLTFEGFSGMHDGTIVKQDEVILPPQKSTSDLVHDLRRAQHGVLVARRAVSQSHRVLAVVSRVIPAHIRSYHAVEEGLLVGSVIAIILSQRREH